MFSFQDHDIVESSGLVVARGLVVTTNDSGDTGRVFTVDPATGKTVGTTGWGDDPRTSRRWRLLDDGAGLGRRHRRQRGVARLGPGHRGAGRARRRRRRGPIYDLVYPDGPHDAETLMRTPPPAGCTSRRKEVLGGTLYAAPAELDPDGANQLRAARRRPADRHRRRVLPRRAALRAPQLRPGRGLRVPVDGGGRRVRPARPAAGRGDRGRRRRRPAAQLGGAALRGAAGGAARRPSRDGASAAVARAPPAVRRAHTESREDAELPETTETQRAAWPWFLGGLIGLGCLLVLIRSLRRR